MHGGDDNPEDTVFIMNATEMLKSSHCPIWFSASFHILRENTHYVVPPSPLKQMEVRGSRWNRRLQSTASVPYSLNK